MTCRVEIVYMFVGLILSSSHVQSNNNSQNNNQVVDGVSASNQMASATSLNSSSTIGEEFDSLVSTLQNVIITVNKLSKTVAEISREMATIGNATEDIRIKCDGVSNYVRYPHALNTTLDGIIIGFDEGVITKALSSDEAQRNLSQAKTEKIESVAFDWNSRKLYFLEEKLGIKRANLDGSKEELVIKGDKWGLAVDSVSGNIYFGSKSSETSNYNITVCDRNGKDCMVVIQNQSAVHDIAFAPFQTLMFWSNGTALVRANMDGTNLSVIFLGHVSAIGVDEDSDELYWGADSKLIRSRDLNGTDPKVLVQGTQHLDGIAVYGGKVYYTDDAPPSRAAVKFVSKDGGDPTVIVGGPPGAHHIALHGKKPAAFYGKNPCESLPCSHLCVPTRESYNCLCPPQLNHLEKWNNCG